MTNKLWYLVGISLKRKIKTKWFIIANIILLLAMIVVVNIDHVINYFGGDFDELTKIYVLDETNYTYEPLKYQIEEMSKTVNNGDINFEVTKYSSKKDELLKEIDKNKKIIGFIIKEDKNNYLDVTMVTNDYMEIINYQLLNNALNNTKVNIALSFSNIDKNTINKIYQPLELKREYLDENKNQKTKVLI